ncbi:hypothetical protein [Methylomonas rivi]|uniref:Uncharacterized protein n=1 Tax=Methylomonas rivi TaxID=2952226 RepID=A0ABT1U489_9GAMM|nr:hypothetical protein [Methylomonas sp. WSC-6]MCQ8128373.1 hypothetical protein [Methylomonas sp. WSC-6]
MIGFKHTETICLDLAARAGMRLNLKLLGTVDLRGAVRKRWVHGRADAVTAEIKRQWGGHAGVSQAMLGKYNELQARLLAGFASVSDWIGSGSLFDAPEEGTAENQASRRCSGFCAVRPWGGSRHQPRHLKFRRKKSL